MEYVICLVILILTIVFLKFIFKVNFAELKKLQENEGISKITDNFPENVEIAKEYLEMLENEEVIIEETHDSKTSLYLVMTNKIVIADMKNNYARLQVIAHECIHSIQDRRLLLFNFIFSNIFILSFLTCIILTILKVVSNISIPLFILTFMSLIQFSVRSFLEIDAMIRSRFLVKEYIEKKQIIASCEANIILDEYERTNKVGIPFVIYNLLTVHILWLATYLIVGIVMKMF